MKVLGVNSALDLVRYFSIYWEFQVVSPISAWETSGLSSDSKDAKHVGVITSSGWTSHG